jgi:hypothetical protein
MNLQQVYKTRKGKRYHCDENCISIRKRTSPISLKDAKMYLKPCSICNPPQHNGELIVYKTRIGRKYHRVDCNNIEHKATSITVNKAESIGLTPCKICCYSSISAERV